MRRQSALLMDRSRAVLAFVFDRSYKEGMGTMAVLLRQVMPEGVDVGMLDEVSDEMGVEGNPPSGMVVHVHFMENGRVNVVDVWDSAEAFETFQNDRLMPAIQKVFERRGVSMDAQPDSSLIEVPTFIRG